jgi:hypothetical protein
METFFALLIGICACALPACGAGKAPAMTGGGGVGGDASADGASADGTAEASVPLCPALGAETIVVTGEQHSWSFDTGFGGLPSDFIGVLGDWRVEAESTAPSSPNVLRQRGTFPVPEFPRAMVKHFTFTDFTLSVKCRPESGVTDQACGAVFRAQDGCNYYVARANAAEGNTRIYISVNGVRTQLGPTALTPMVIGTWYTLGVTANGPDLSVRMDGVEVITASDSTFVKGKIGVWTKADSVTAFDDLEATEN